MTRRTTTAPGKLVLAGEYAVLLGHEAIVAAVDRRATCAREPSSGLVVSGADGEPYEAQVREERVVFPDDRDDELKLLRLVLDHARARGVPLPQAHLSVSTRAFVDERTGQKLGLGSSAAAAVALAAQLCVGDDGALAVDLVHEIAAAAHRAFSRGKGSGVDVAASSLGGVRRYARGAVVGDWRLPPDVAVVAASAGAPQDTRDFVERFLQAPERIALAGPLADAAQALAAARGLADVVAAVDAARDGMRRLGEACGIDVVSPPHARIASIAGRLGGAAKPSGAGGGDLSVCFVAADEAPLLELALAEQGLDVVPLRMGATGATVEP